MHNIDLSTDFRHKPSLEVKMMYGVNNENLEDKAFMAIVKKVENILDNIDNQPPSRLVRTHLPAHLLPANIWTVKPKLIYMYRNPRDVAISMYHMLKNCSFYKHPGSLEDFFELFLNDQIIYGSFFGHYKSFQQFRELNNMLFLSYEQMMDNPFDEVKKISKFLNYTYNDDQLKRITKHLSFQNMRDNNGTELIRYSNDYKLLLKWFYIWIYNDFE